MKRNQKGFTLAELLIVVAIIAVLVAIAIPIFNNQLEKSRETTDLANIRAAYAEIMAAAVEGETSADNLKSVIADGGTITYSSTDGTYTADVLAKQTKAGWETSNKGIAVAGLKTADSGTGVVLPAFVKYRLIFTVATNALTITNDPS